MTVTAKRTACRIALALAVASLGAAAVRAGDQVDPSQAGEIHLRLSGQIQINAADGIWILSHDPVAGKPARLSWGNQSIEAGLVLLFRDEMAVYAEKNVRLRRPGMLLRAESLYYEIDAGRGSARDVRLHASRRLIGEFLDQRAEIPKLEVAHTRLDQVILSADRITWTAPTLGPTGKALPGRLEARDVTLTTCDFARPHWHIRSRRIDAEFTDAGFTRLSSHGNRLVLGRRTVLRLPRIGQDLRRPGRISALEVAARSSKEWGTTVLTHLGFDFSGGASRPRPAPLAVGTVGLDLDFREERGFAGSFEAAYRTGASGRGRLRYTFLVETEISPIDDADRAATNQLRFQTGAFRNLGKITGIELPVRRYDRRYEENNLFELRHAAEILAAPAGPQTLYADHSRFALDYQHRSSWLEPGDAFGDQRLDLDLETQVFRDRDYRQEYEEDRFKSSKDPVTLAAVRYQNLDFVSEVAANWRVNDFFSRTEYLPEARLRVPGRPIGGGFLLNASLAAGRLRRKFDEFEGIPDIETTRLHSYVQLSRPTRVGPFQINAFAATQQTWYDDSYTGEGFWQGTFLHAVELSTRLYGKFPVRDPASDVAGYRHIIEPRVRYLSVSEPTHDPADAFDFDEIDDINEQDRLTFSLDQKLQMKKRGGAVRDLASLELSVDMFTEDGVAERLNSGNDFDVLRAAAIVSPSDRVDFHANALWGLHGTGVEEAVGGILLHDPAHVWRADVSARITRDLFVERGIPGSTQIDVRLETPLSRNWRIGLMGRYEFEEPPPGTGLADRGLTDARVVVTRVFHDWLLSVRVGFDEAEDDFSVSLNIYPRGSAENLRRASGELVEVGAAPAADSLWP